MPVTAEQATTELRRRKATNELAQRKRPDFGMIALPKDKLPGVWDYNRQLESLLGDEKNIEDFIPLDVKYDFGQIIGMTEKPDETKDKMATSLFYSIELGIPPRTTFNVLDELNKIAFDETIPASTAWGRIKQRYRTGKAQVQLMDLGYDILKGTWRDWEKYESSLKNIEKLQSGMTIDQQKEFRGFFEKLVGASAELAPFGLEAIKEFPVGAAIGGTIFGIGAALATAAIPTIGEEAVIPPAIITGMKIGAGIKGAIRVGELEAGGMFLELAQMKDQYGNKIDPRIAVVASAAVGTINGGIELAEWQVLLGTFGLSKKLFDKSVRKVTHKLFTQGTLKELIARKILDYSIALGAETLQEIEQETTTIVFGELAKELNNARKGTDFKPITAEALTTRYREVTVESMRAFGLMVLPGTTISGALELVAQKKAATEIAAKEVEKIEVKAPVSAKKRTEAIDFVKSVLSQEQFAALDEKTRTEIGQKMLAEQGVEVEAAELAEIPPTVPIVAPEPTPTGRKAEIAPVAKQPWEMKATSKEWSELSIEKVDRAAFGFAREDIKKLNPNELTVKWKEDYENAIEQQKQSGLSKEEWAKSIDLSEPIDVIFEDGKFKIDDGYHRFYAAEILNKPLNVELTIKDKPHKAIIEKALSEGKPVPAEVLAEYPDLAPVAKPEAAKVEKVEPTKPKDISPIVEPELTKQEEADVARLEAEIEKPFEMIRIKNVGFVIKEKATGKEVATIAKRKEAKAKLAEYNKGERKIRETRRKPKLLTDKTTIGKLITEARALKAAMKKAAQAARKAYQVGKAEGITKAKVYYQGIRQREQVRKQLKKRITKAVKTITKDIPKSVDFKYREAIENLRAGIDPQFRMKKTLQMRERTREFLAQNPEALKDMPVKLLKKLAQKPMSEYTIEEVEQIAEEIERLTKQGKLKRELQTKQKARKIEKTTQDITETISKGEKIDFESEPVTYETTKQGIIKTVFEKTKAWTWRPSRIFDLLDGVKDFAGKAHHIFIDQVNSATNAKLQAVDKRKDAGIAKMKELGITPRDLAQVRTVDDVRYMVDEMIGIYCANENRLAKLALMYGNNLSEKAINDVIANLTENEKAWGDFIISEYETRYDVLREKVIEVENRDMGYEENYTPIRRTEVDYSTHTEEIIDAILQREHLRRTYAEHGFTIHRKDVPAEFQKPIRLNVTSVWASQIVKQEQYIHFAELVRDLHKIAGDRDFKAAVQQQFGREFNKVIKNYIDRVANPNIYKSYNTLENLSRRLRQNAATAYLAYNLVTMAKQVPSTFLYLQDAGPTHLVSSAMEFVRNPLKMVDMVREKDPQVKHRSIERELEEMKNRNPEMYNSILTKFGRAGMEGIYLFDAVARTIGWNAVYQKALNSNKSEAEAVRLAQNATLRTQPAAAAKDVAQLYATNEFANWFTMFTNQLNQIYNIATYDMSGYLKNRDYQKFALATTGLSLTALTIWIIAHRRLPEDKEDWVDVASEQAINSVPLIGKAIMAGKREWGSTEIPAFELPKAAGRAVSAVAKGKFDKNDIKAIAEGVAVTVGIPYIGPKRVIKMVDTGEVKELIGGEPIRKKKAPARKRIERSE